MRNEIARRLSEITAATLIVGVDIAKDFHWAQFVDSRGIPISKPMRFASDRIGFDCIVARIHELCDRPVLAQPYTKVIVGMEPTGHYWKTFAHYLAQTQIKAVGVNPYHTKKAKELDDNSQTKSDKKDALTIARLVTEGRYFEPYLTEGVYAQLRVLGVTRANIKREENRVKNTITAVIDEYFPELYTVIKKPLNSKAGRQILRDCPFPKWIQEKGETQMLEIVRKAAKRGIGIKRVRQLMQAAKVSVGVAQGLSATALRLNMLLDEFEMYQTQYQRVEEAMAQALKETGYAEQLLGIKGIGVVTAAGFLGEVGDPLRFESAQQIVKLAGLSLVEDSSGKSKSKTHISKRGRPLLRGLLYTMAVTLSSRNPQLRQLFNYLKQRRNNPLKGKQALIAIATKAVSMIYSMLKHGTQYCPEKVLGEVRQNMLQAA